MILINLLPHREAARKRRKEEFQAMLLASAVVGLVIAGCIYLWFEMLINAQQGRNNFLRTEIAALDETIKDVTTLESEIELLRARQKAVEDLQSDRNLPVHMFNELVMQLPDGMYLSNLKQIGRVVSIQGVAQSNERISEMLRNIAGNTPWFAKPELLEIIATNIELTAKDQRKVPSFNMRFHLVRNSEEKATMDEVNDVEIKDED